MKIRPLHFLAIAMIGFLSCEEDDENLNEIGNVSFSLDQLTEVENATNALAINMGIDSFNHSGGTIDVVITGGDYGTDYETSSGSANFTLDVAQQSLVSAFSIIPIDNDIIEPNTVLTITLSAVSGALELGENTTLSFTILDNDDPLIAMVGFESETGQTEENSSNPLMINIPFNQATTDGGTITVSSSGDAIYGTDYTVNGQNSENFNVTVPAGATSASFEIQAIDNSDFEANKTVSFSLDDTSGGLSLGVDTQTTITIINDDSPPNPVIDFSGSNTLAYNEDTGVITLNFDISQMTTEDATIELTTSGSADVGDFNFNGSTSPYSFVIPSGSTTASVDITIVNDEDIESDETIILDITSVLGGLDAGLNLQQQTITIIDNDNAGFNYVETFETVADLDAAGFQAFLLPTQDLPASKLFKYNMNGGKYADVNDETQSSDTGLVVFYSNTQNGNGIIDNVVITPQMAISGATDVSVDIAYSQAPQFNNADITFYYSETYNGSGTWTDTDWTVMGTETAASMETDGYATNDYKRKVMSINPASNFYVAVRVNQIIDDTFWKTQWRLDNFKVNN
ncbi:hypothetical protein N8009_02100 [Flavobacteriaceae bacterium]|nr:hypothetical protein [Flavobacteriaceae bacterium]